MAREYCYPKERTSLTDYYEMAWRCAKCAYCRNVFPSDTESEKFAGQCPCGERFQYEAYYASGRNELARIFIEGKRDFTDRLRHILYTCTTCGHCDEWCSAMTGLYPLKITDRMRKYYFENGGQLYPEHKKMVKAVRESRNRLNRNNDERMEWLNGIKDHRSRGHKTKDRGTEKPGLIYFVGCRSSFKRKEIAASTYSILNKLGIEISFLDDEWCCGRPMLDIGDEKSALECMQHNITEIESQGAGRVLFSCAECFHTFNDLEKFGLEKRFDTVHITQFLEPILEDIKLTYNGETRNITFHDPCYLARHEGILNEPRKILSAVEGLELVEMPRNRKNSWCCGSGGGVQEAFPDYSQWTAARRMEEVLSIGADMIVTSCPGCKNNLWPRSRANRIEILDFTELLDRVIKDS